MDEVNPQFYYIDLGWMRVRLNQTHIKDGDDVSLTEDLWMEAPSPTSPIYLEEVTRSIGTQTDPPPSSFLQKCRDSCLDCYDHANITEDWGAIAFANQDLCRSGLAAGIDETGFVRGSVYEGVGAQEGRRYIYEVYRQTRPLTRLEMGVESIQTTAWLPVQLLRRVVDVVAHLSCCMYQGLHPESGGMRRRICAYYTCVVCGDLSAIPLEVGHTATKVGCFFCTCCYPETMAATKVDGCPECMDRIGMLGDVVHKIRHPDEKLLSTRAKEEFVAAQPRKMFSDV